MSTGILSVNGNNAMNYLLQTIFKKEFKFESASNVYDGMLRLKTNKNIVALIIDLDYQPQESWELIEHIKSSKLYNLPIAVLTTENNEKLRHKCYELEIDEIFFKPFNPEDLVAAFRNSISMNAVSN